MKDGKSASEYLLCGIGKKKLDRYNGETQDFYTFGSYIATFNELEIIALTSAGDAPGSHGDPPPTDVIATMKSLLDQIAILHHLKCQITAKRSSHGTWLSARHRPYTNKILEPCHRGEYLAGAHCPLRQCMSRPPAPASYGVSAIGQRMRDVKIFSMSADRPKPLGGIRFKSMLNLARYRKATRMTKYMSVCNRFHLYSR